MGMLSNPPKMAGRGRTTRRSTKEMNADDLKQVDLQLPNEPLELQPVSHAGLEHLAGQQQVPPAASQQQLVPTAGHKKQAQQPLARQQQAPDCRQQRHQQQQQQRHQQQQQQGARPMTTPAGRQGTSAVPQQTLNASPGSSREPELMPDQVLSEQVAMLLAARPNRVWAPMSCHLGRHAHELGNYKNIKHLSTDSLRTRVVCAARTRKGVRVALKVFDLEAVLKHDLVRNKGKQDKGRYWEMMNEIRMMRSLSHDHIVKSFGAFEEDGYIVMVMECAQGGDLAGHIPSGGMSEAAAVQHLRPILEAVQYLHSKDILHRNIKPENILCTDQGPKLCDFGICVDVDLHYARGYYGTPLYMAPEVMCGTGEDYGLPADVWSVGVVALELLVGHLEFQGDTRTLDCLDGHTQVPAWSHLVGRLPPNLSPSAQDFLTLAMTRDPDQRPSVSTLINHPWIQGASS